MNAAFWTTSGAVLGFLGVAAGAFGAHGLEAKLEPRLLEVWKTAAHYELIHALALVGLAALLANRPEIAQTTSAQLAGWGFLAGTLVFSGSLYLLALTGTRWLGAITPIGGTLFLTGWIALAILSRKLVS